MNKPLWRRRWLRFGLRTLLICTLGFSLLFGWVAKERRRGKYVSQFVKAGNVNFYQSPRLSARSLLKGLLGDQIAGDIESLGLTYAHIADADMEGVGLIPEAKSLNIIDNPISDDGLKSLRYLRELEELYIGGQYARGITDVGLRRLKGLRRLRVLELRQTGIKGDGLEVLAKMPELEILSLWDSHVDDRASVHLKKLTNLKKLVVGRTNLSKSAVEELIRALPSCEVVDDA